MRSGVAIRLETSRDRLIISRNCLLSRENCETPGVKLHATNPATIPM